MKGPAGMAQTSLPIDFKRLSVAERIRLVEEIWDSIAEENLVLPPTKAQQDELDRRLDSLENGAPAGNTWDVIKQRLLERK
jgi:putative addiction module component (TIGR02574 family)